MNMKEKLSQLKSLFSIETILLIISVSWNIPIFILWFIVYPKKIIKFVKLQKDIKHGKV